MFNSIMPDTTISEVISGLCYCEEITLFFTGTKSESGRLNVIEQTDNNAPESYIYFDKTYNKWPGLKISGRNVGEIERIGFYVTFNPDFLYIRKIELSTLDNEKNIFIGGSELTQLKQDIAFDRQSKIKDKYISNK